jgi:hypothetical protein
MFEPSQSAITFYSGVDEYNPTLPDLQRRAEGDRRFIGCNAEEEEWEGDLERRPRFPGKPGAPGYDELLTGLLAKRL